MNYDILTPCHQCGRIMHIPYSTWDLLYSQKKLNNDQNDNSQSSFSSSSISPHSIKQKVDCTLHFVSNSNDNASENINNGNDFKFIQKFQKEKRKQTFSSSNITYFPLCQDCSSSCTYHLRNFKKLFEKTSFFIDSKLKSIPTGVFEIQYENAIAHVPKNQLKIKSSRSLNSSSSQNDSSIFNRLNNNKHSIQISDNVQYDSINLDDKNSSLPQKSFCPFYSFSLFMIGTDYHYGTINDLRIGFYDYSPNSILESNLALYNIAHLIYTLKSALCIDKINIILASQPSISVIANSIYDSKDQYAKKGIKSISIFKLKEKRKDIDGDNNEEKEDSWHNSPNTFNLVLPEISQKYTNGAKKVIVSEASKKKFNSQYYDNINNAIHSLFHAFVLIDNASSRLSKYSSPDYIVNLNDKTIGNVSYVFDWKNIEDWSLAMRMLLFNLKKIQVIFIRSYL